MVERKAGESRYELRAHVCAPAKRRRKARVGKFLVGMRRLPIDARVRSHGLREPRVCEISPSSQYVATDSKR